MPLEELGLALGTGSAGALGKYSRSLVSRVIGGQVQLVCHQVRLQQGLEAETVSAGILLSGATMEPAKRLPTEAETKAWLDTVVAAYAHLASISVSWERCGWQQRSGNWHYGKQ
jgi:fatty acid synthase subunit alpha